MTDNCDLPNMLFAPPGEYIKDHSLIFEGGRWHFFSISGQTGRCWLDKGSEESISHSSSPDLVNWVMHGHPVKASGKDGYNDEHMAVAPHVVKANDGLFYMAYSGWRHPNKRPNFNYEGHLESIYMAVSNDLFNWNIPEHIEPCGITVTKGEPIKGRDPHLFFDAKDERWLLYYTRQTDNAPFSVGVAQSRDLNTWENMGDAIVIQSGDYIFNPCESPFVLKHPLSGKYILLLNWDYSISEDPLRFDSLTPLPFKAGIVKNEYTWEGVGAGFAREVISHNGQNYFSGVLGPDGYFKLGFTPFRWTDEFLELEI
ncbi:MAG: hypothetical protein ACIAQZ_12010 [Sedimentisphaeraceae bacterium JB056]